MIGSSPEASFRAVQQGDFALEWAVDRDSLWSWLLEGWLRNVLRHDMISFARDPDPDKDSGPSLHPKRNLEVQQDFLVTRYNSYIVPVVPHKAVAEVSK